MKIMLTPTEGGATNHGAGSDYYLLFTRVIRVASKVEDKAHSTN